MNDKSKPWTQKYAPKKTSEVMGQEKAVSYLKSFILNFRKEKKKAAIIYGPTGCGKTCSLYATANELGLEVIELNASDFRTEENISSIIGNASKQMSLFFRGKVILIDEIDGISGTQDRGGIPELGRIIEGTAFPIILTADDPFDKKFSDLRKKSEMIEFSALSPEDVLKIISNIAGSEGIECDDYVLKSISRRVGGDARAAVNDLQMLCINGKISRQDLDALSDRERTEEISTALTKVFKTTDPMIAKTSFDTVGEDVNQCIMWVDENLPKEYEKPEDLARAYDYLSKADVMNRRIMRQQHWRFLTYINDYISAGVAVSKDEKYKKIVSYEQSKRPLKIFLANLRYQKRMAICEKIAGTIHASKHEVVRDTYPYIKAMFKLGKNKEMLSSIEDGFGFDKQEVEYLKK